MSKLGGFPVGVGVLGPSMWRAALDAVLEGGFVLFVSDEEPLGTANVEGSRLKQHVHPCFHVLMQFLLRYTILSKELGGQLTWVRREDGLAGWGQRRQCHISKLLNSVVAVKAVKALADHAVLELHTCSFDSSNKEKALVDSLTQRLRKYGRRRDGWSDR